MNEKESFLSAFRVRAAGIAALICIGLALLGLYRLVFVSGPMLAQNYEDAYGYSSSSEAPLVLYDLGLQHYKFKRYAPAKAVFTEAFNQLTKNTGVVPEDQQALAGQIQFMLGVVNEQEKQFRVAVSAYEESLRHDPNNLAAKYNLERLKSQFPDMGKGKGQPDPKDPSNGSGAPPKKGI